MTDVLNQFERRFAGTDTNDPAVRREMFEWVRSRVDEVATAVIEDLRPEWMPEFHKLSDLTDNR